MEATAISIGKSVLSGALNYAQSAVAEEVALQLGVQRDHSFISDELEMMQGFLTAAHDERDDSMVVKIWVKQVRDVSYAVEDCLLDIAVRLEKQSWWCLSRKVLARHYVAEQMKELKAKVEEVSQRNQRYHLIKGSSSKPTSAIGQPINSSATMSAADDARLRRHKAKKDLVELINCKDDALRVIALWGRNSSDLGELSIIKNIYEDPMIQKNFDCCACITLMYPFNQTDFIQSIVRQIYDNSFQETGEEGKTTIGAQVLKTMMTQKEDDGLAHVFKRFLMQRTEEAGLAYEFKRYLNDKSYLIVFKEIHTMEEWDCIKTCFPDNKKGSRIIVSTEQVEVASLCIGAEDEALVRKKLFSDRSLYAFYKKVAQEGRNLKKSPALELNHTGGPRRSTAATARAAAFGPNPSVSSRPFTLTTVFTILDLLPSASTAGSTSFAACLLHCRCVSPRCTRMGGPVDVERFDRYLPQLEVRRTRRPPSPPCHPFLQIGWDKGCVE